MAKKYEGLLTPELARRCEDATEDEILWLAYFADGDIEPAHCNGIGGWCIGEYSIGQGLADSEEELIEAGPLGFAPYPHEMLPMVTAPQDGARIEVRLFRESFIGAWDSSLTHLVGGVEHPGIWRMCGSGNLYHPADCSGRAPIVTATEEAPCKS